MKFNLFQYKEPLKAHNPDEMRVLSNISTVQMTLIPEFLKHTLSEFRK